MMSSMTLARPFENNLPSSVISPTFMIRGGSYDDSNDSNGWGASPPPPTPPATDPRVLITEALVRSAVSLLLHEGSSCNPTLRSSQKFRPQSDVYVFIYDLNGTVLFNAGSPSKEGHNTRGLTDTSGFAFHDALITAAETKLGEKWVKYDWPKPGESEASRKWTFAKTVEIDGIEAVVMIGFYE